MPWALPFFSQRLKKMYGKDKQRGQSSPQGQAALFCASFLLKHPINYAHSNISYAIVIHEIGISSNPAQSPKNK